MDKNFPALFQVKRRAPEGTTSAFPTYPGERSQAGAVGHCTLGLPKGPTAQQEEFRVVHVCIHTALGMFLGL